MRRGTAFSVWDALGYLVWGYGWAVLDPAETLPDVQGMHLGVDQRRSEPPAAIPGLISPSDPSVDQARRSPWDGESGPEARFDGTKGAPGALVTGNDRGQAG
jgi:hypothetical protein